MYGYYFNELLYITHYIFTYIITHYTYILLHIEICCLVYYTERIIFTKISKNLSKNRSENNFNFPKII